MHRETARPVENLRLFETIQDDRR